MNTIEQAKQVVELLKEGQAGDCSPSGNRYAAIDTINALIAELASIKGQEPAKISQAVRDYNEIVDKYNALLAAGANAHFEEQPDGSVIPVDPSEMQAQERKPLSDRQISLLWSHAHNDTTDRMAFQVLARAIEAAHGIKGQP